MANGPGQWGDRGRPSREDLYQSFGSSITIPPLRSRKVDIPLRTNPISNGLPAPHDGFHMNEFLDELKLHLIQRTMELAGGV